MKLRKISGLLFLLMLAAGCGSDTIEETQKNQNSVEEETLQEETAADSTQVLLEKENIYDSILEQYSDMVQNDFYMDLLGSEDYQSRFGEEIGLEIRVNPQDIYYALYDIDGNGTMELLIAAGTENPDFSVWNYDLYGYNGTSTGHMFPEMEFGYRTNFSLFENGVIEVFYSISAAESGVDFYQIGSDGFTPELIDSFVTVANLDNGEAVFLYYQNGNEITEQEYDTNIKNYEIPLEETLQWIKIQ